MSVHDVLARKSVHDVVALNTYTVTSSVSCSYLGYVCGNHYIPSCGTYIDCGGCTPPDICVGAICECSPALACSMLGYECGTQTVCGYSTSCGTCPSGTCNSATGKCVTSCTDTCASLGYECGTVCGVSCAPGCDPLTQTCSADHVCKPISRGETACTDRCSPTYNYTSTGAYISSTSDCNTPISLPNAYEKCSCTIGSDKTIYSSFYAGCAPGAPVTLPAPTGLSATCSSGGTSVTLSWVSVSGASYYSIRMDKNPTSWDETYWNTNCIGSGSWYNGDYCQNILSTTSKTLAVTPDTPYQWWVHSRNAAGEWSDSSVDDFICESGEVPPEGCIPISCAGRECGGDGCGGSCGPACPALQKFSNGQCVFVPESTWRNTNDAKISKLTATLNQGTEILMVLMDDRIEAGETSANFSIYKANTFWFDKIVDSSEGGAVMDDRVNGIFSIDYSGLTAGEYKLYFIASANDGAFKDKSNDLTLTINGNPELDICTDSVPAITTCAGYTTGTDCTSNVCSVPYTKTGCGQPTGEICALVEECPYILNCDCAWNSSTSKCSEVANEELILKCAGSGCPNSLGECSISQELEAGDDCTNGFLTYSWTAVWDWKNNSYTSQGGNVLLELGTDGKWHYPASSKDSCIDGEPRAIPCPTGVALPFFGVLELFATLILRRHIILHSCEGCDMQPSWKKKPYFSG